MLESQNTRHMDELTLLLLVTVALRTSTTTRRFLRCDSMNYEKRAYRTRSHVPSHPGGWLCRNIGRHWFLRNDRLLPSTVR